MSGDSPGFGMPGDPAGAGLPPWPPSPGVPIWPPGSGLPPGPATGMPPGLVSDYDPSVKITAGLVAFFLPLITLIAALVIRPGEASPARRASLRVLAVASGAWLSIHLLVGIAAFAAVTSSGPQVSHDGPCMGGPDTGAVGEPVGHGNYRFDCWGGGSTIVHIGS